MKFNERELARMSEEKSDMEGRMSYKRVNSNQYYQSVFKERWFKLIDNFLFYFRIAEKQVIGVLILENANIQVENEPECSFAFSITFNDEPEKKHIFSCMSEANVALWVSKIECASYEYLRNQLYLLQSDIYTKTGKDPLLMVPRNAGSMHWAPGQPLPIKTVPNEQSQPIYNIPGFTSHLSNQFAVSSIQPTPVYRSKSSANVSNKPAVTNGNSPLEQSWPGCSGVERSKSTAFVFAEDHFSNFKPYSHLNKMYNRPAPSPPPRRKNSPQLKRNGIIVTAHMNDDFISGSDNKGEMLSQPPLPPQRRNSPKFGLVNKETNSNEFGKTANSDPINNSSEDDLIKF